MTVFLEQMLFDLRDRLPMWVVHQFPDDAYGLYVARLWMSLPEPAVTNFTIRCPELEPLREQLIDLGFYRRDRSPEDEPQILETWHV
jgi:hypothetical protein